MITVDEAFAVVDKHLRSSDAQHRTQKINKMSATKEMELCCSSSNNVRENSALHKLQGVNQSDNFDHILPAFRTSWRDGPCPYHSYRGQAQCTTQQIVDDLIDTEIVYENEADDTSKQCHHYNKSKEEEMMEIKLAWKDHKLQCTLIPSTFHTVVEPTKVVVMNGDDEYMKEPTNTFAVTTNPQRDRAELQNAINTNKLKSEWSVPENRRALLEQHCVRHYPFGAFGLTETPLTNNTGKVYKQHKEHLRRLCNRQCRQVRNSDFTPPDHIFGPICTRSSPIVRGRLFNAPTDHLLGALLL